MIGGSNQKGEYLTINGKPNVFVRAEKIDCKHFVTYGKKWFKCELLTQYICLYREKPCPFRESS